MHIITLFPNDFLWNNTFTSAITNLATELNFKHYHINMIDDLNGSIDLVPITNGKVIYIYTHHPHLDKTHLSRLKSRIPNSKTVMIGGDCIYDGYDNWPVDLGIEFNRSVVEKMNSMYPSEFIYWTPSKNVFHRIREIRKEQVFEKKYDIMCLANMHCSAERINFIEGFCNNDKKIMASLREYNLDKVIQYYSECNFSLGVSHAVWGSYEKRSAKGFRDYIGPECGTPLIADDLPEMTELSDIIPIYPFNNFIEAIKLMKYYEDNAEEYKNLIEKQKSFFYSINMENQLRPIISKLMET